MASTSQAAHLHSSITRHHWCENCTPSQGWKAHSALSYYYFYSFLNVLFDELLVCVFHADMHSPFFGLFALHKFEPLWDNSSLGLTMCSRAWAGIVKLHQQREWDLLCQHTVTDISDAVIVAKLIMFDKRLTWSQLNVSLREGSCLVQLLYSDIPKIWLNNYKRRLSSEFWDFASNFYCPLLLLPYFLMLHPFIHTQPTCPLLPFSHLSTFPVVNLTKYFCPIYLIMWFLLMKHNLRGIFAATISIFRCIPFSLSLHRQGTICKGKWTIIKLVVVEWLKEWQTN